MCGDTLTRKYVSKITDKTEDFIYSVLHEKNNTFTRYFHGKTIISILNTLTYLQQPYIILRPHVRCDVALHAVVFEVIAECGSRTPFVFLSATTF